MRFLPISFGAILMFLGMAWTYAAWLTRSPMTAFMLGAVPITFGICLILWG